MYGTITEICRDYANREIIKGSRDRSFLRMAEHITPGGSLSNSTNGEGKDEAELGSSPSYSINREFCSYKKGCSSRHCGCVMKRAAVFAMEENHAK